MEPPVGNSGTEAVKDRYRFLFEAMTEGLAVCEIIRDGEGRPVDFRYLEVNPAFARHTGLTDVVGRTVRELIPGVESYWVETYARVVDTGEPARIEAPVATLGKTFEVYAYRVARDQFMAVFFDVTARRRLEEAARESEAWFRAVFDSASDGIVIATPEGIVTQMNPAAVAFFSLVPEVAVGRPFPHPMRPGDCRELKLPAGPGQDRFVEMQVSEMLVGDRRFLRAGLRDLTPHVRLRDDLRAKALLDDLTGVLNRRGLMTIGPGHLAYARRNRLRLWLLFADLDGMKWINDTLGHDTGDRALIEFSEVLKSTLRHSDIVARIGGDEFAAVALDATNDGFSAIEERLDRAAEARNAAKGRTYRLSFSVGAALFDPEAPASLEELLAEADRRMYERKRARRASTFIVRPFQ